MLELHWIRLKLYQWGRLCRADGVGYPTMASHEKARIGRGGVFEGPNLPDDLAEIDVAVSRSPPQHKLIIVECYTKHGDARDHAARLRLSRDSFYRRKKMAEVFLYQTLRTATENINLRAS
jgi:hypothetical protein